jgi:hypothetical protein
MSKALFLIFSMAISLCTANAYINATTANPSTSPAPHTAPSVEWTKTYTAGLSRGVIQTSDGGYATVGDTFIKTDPNGNVQWNTTLGVIISFSSVIQTSDGARARTHLLSLDVLREYEPQLR